MVSEDINGISKISNIDIKITNIKCDYTCNFLIWFMHLYCNTKPIKCLVDYDRENIVLTNNNSNTNFYHDIFTYRGSHSHA